MNINNIFKRYENKDLFLDDKMKFFKYKKQRNKLYTVIAYNKYKRVVWRSYNEREETLDKYKEEYDLLEESIKDLLYKKIDFLYQCRLLNKNNMQK
jgi:hypothetical protein